MEQNILHKEVLLKLLDKFVEVCQQNGLKYYLAGGTVLGAVRHKGMIPWDDDIDVYLHRVDYDKIQSLSNDVWGPDMRLASWRKVKNYRYDFLKVELLNTTLIERIHPNYVGGVFLDIFPLDSVPSDIDARTKLFIRFNKIVEKHYKAYIKSDSECHNFVELCGLKFFRLINKKPRILEQWEKLVSCKYANSDLIANSHDFRFTDPLPYSYYGDGVDMEFEGKMYKVPANWDGYLTHIYGDYMTPPPESDRIGHAFDYVNYDCRLENYECKKIFNEVNRKYRYACSFKSEIKNLLKTLGLYK